MKRHGSRLRFEGRSRLLVLLLALAAGLGLVLPGVAEGRDLDDAFGPTRNLWIDRDTLRSVPTSGSAWDRLADDAKGGWGSADVSDQESDHDVYTFAGALYAVRMNDTAMRARVVSAIEDAIGTERGGRTLALGRNLTGYVLAADLVGYDSARFRDWLRSVRTANLDGRTLIETHEDRPNNWGTHAGAARIVADLFIGDTKDLARATRVFRGYLGDRGAYAGFNFGDDEWQANRSAPVPINPAGARINGINVDGAIVDDVRRCECSVRSPAPQENYQWEAMQGIVTQATLLYAAGVSDVWTSSDAAIHRATRFLYQQARYPASGDDTAIPFLIDAALGTNYAAGMRANVGKSIGYTDVTHPSGSRATTRSFIETADVPATRLLETRRGSGFATVDGKFEGDGQRPAGSITKVKVAGRGGVPKDATTAILNLVAVRPTGPGFLTAYPCTDNVPLAATLNYGPGTVVANAVYAKLNRDGEICIYTKAASDLVVDVNGYVPDGSDLGNVDPARLLETRQGVGFDTVDGKFEGAGQRPAGTVTKVKVAGRGGVPEDATTAMLNLVAVHPTGPGFLTAYPCTDKVPLAATLNYGPGTVVANAVYAELNSDGEICIYTKAASHLIIDASGYVRG